MIKIKEIIDTAKAIISQRKLKIFKEYLVYIGENTTQCKNNKSCGECDMIIEGKSYTFKNPKTKFVIHK